MRPKTAPCCSFNPADVTPGWNPCLINRIVLCELVWMLDRGYRYRRELIAGVIEKILHTEKFFAENATEAWAALSAYRQG